jgi:hypothetical protein
MSELDPQHHQKYAESCRKEGQLQTAGNYYANAAFGWFMKFRHIPNENKDLNGECSNNIKPAYIGYSISDLIFSSLCYRINKMSYECRNRCMLGILLVDNIRVNEKIFNEDAELGFCNEVIGDLKLVGDIEGSAKSYQEAESYYEQVSNPISWQAEPEFEAAIIPHIDLSISVGYGFGESDRESIMYKSLLSRISYKKNHFRDIIKKVIEAGNW